MRIAAILALALAGLLLTDGTAEANTINSPDTAGNVGGYTSLVLDAGGRPVVSYYAWTNWDLKVLHCGNPDCSGGNSITSPDTTGDVGSFTSLALDASGYPVVSYRDATNNKLKVMHCNDANCAGGGETMASFDAGGWHSSLVLDSSGNPVVSYVDDYELKVLHCGDANCSSGNIVTSPDPGLREAYSSLALDGSGNPVISYQDYLNLDLKVMHCDDDDCDSRSITSLDTAEDAGDWPSLALDSGGKPVVSYYDLGNGELRLLHCGNADCTLGNSISSPDTPTSGGGAGWLSSSLVLDSAGNPVVSYHNEIDQDLRILHCGNPDCTGGNTTASPDTAGSVGSDSSMALDANGRPVISYLYATDDDLRMLHCDNANCAAGTPATNTIVSPDPTTHVGQYTSLVLDAGGRPVVSYHDVFNGDLKVLHCGDADCTAGNSIASPDTPDHVGEGTSLALDGSGNPVVSYWDYTNGDLKVLHCGNAACTAGNSIASPDTTGDVGRESSVAVDGAGNPIIAYSDSTNGDLKVLHCGNANCTAGNSITSPDTANTVGLWPSLVLDTSGKPVISYYASTLGDLKVLHCGNADCTAGNSIASPDTVGVAGYYPSLALDAAGSPVVSYWDYTNSRLKVLHCGNANCTAGNSITSAAAQGSVLPYTSLALDAAGNPVVSYHDSSNGDLKVLHCGNANCTADNTVTSVDAVANTGGYPSLALNAAGNPVVSYYDDTAAGSLNVLHCETPTCAQSTISTIAGKYDDPGFVDGSVEDVKFDSPHGLAKAADGGLLVADTNNDAIRKIDAAKENVSTVAGGGSGCDANHTAPYDGCLATEATLSEPRDVFDQNPPGDMYIADTGNNRIRKVDADGYISTIAGDGTADYGGDGGAATAAKLNAPSGVAVDTAGNVYIADTGNNRIRKVDGATGIITTIVGNGTAGYAGDHDAAMSAELNGPRDVYPWGSIYAGTTDLLIADTGNNVIRWVHGPSGLIDTLAGTGSDGFSGDGDVAVAAELNGPEAVASDASLAVLIADTQNNRLRRVTFGDATIITLAGGGSGCDANHTAPYDGCPGTDAVLDHPAGVALGSCQASDTGSQTIRGIDSCTGLPVGGFTGSTGCTYGTTATIDVAFMLLPLGLILGRRRIRIAFGQIRRVSKP